MRRSSKRRVKRGSFDKLAALRDPGESYSDVILRLVEAERA
jgi:hypothetical protein